MSGGQTNIASGSYATVSGGQTNWALSEWATIGGGGDNQATGARSVVAGGSTNEASGGNASIGGGGGNIASGGVATVSGGQSNTASREWSSVGGGQSNTASGPRAVVAGGSSNTASGGNATVGGGGGNIASGLVATIGGGESNSASGLRAAVGGGYTNRVTDDYGSVSGGRNNQAGNNAGTSSDRPYGTVSGGYTNSASGSYATVPGGSPILPAAPSPRWVAGQQHGQWPVRDRAGRLLQHRRGSSASLPDGGKSQPAWHLRLGRQHNADIASTANNQFIARASGGVRFCSNGAAPARAVDPGTWRWLLASALSDRNVKANFAAVDSAASWSGWRRCRSSSGTTRARMPASSTSGRWRRTSRLPSAWARTTPHQHRRCRRRCAGRNPGAVTRSWRLRRSANGREPSRTQLQERMAAMEQAQHGGNSPVQVASTGLTLSWRVVALGVVSLIVLLILSTVSLTLLFLRRRTHQPRTAPSLLQGRIFGCGPWCCPSSMPQARHQLAALRETRRLHAVSFCALLRLCAQ